MRMRIPTCKVHHKQYICAACVGAKGGGKRSPAKTLAARANAKKRWEKATVPPAKTP